MIAAGLGTACAGAIAGAAGVELPAGVGGALSYATDMLGWLRLVILALLVVGVMRARE